MSWISYTSFPKELRAFRISKVRGREKEFGINYDISHWHRDNIYLFPGASPEEGQILVVDKRFARFDNCFKNKFIYRIELIGIRDDTMEQRGEVVQKYMDEEKITGHLDRESMDREVRKCFEPTWTKCQRAKYDFFNKNPKCWRVC